MILHMIQLNPDERFSAEAYLLKYAGMAFPNYFSPFLHNFYSCLGSLDPDARVIDAYAKSFCVCTRVLSMSLPVPSSCLYNS